MTIWYVVGGALALAAIVYFVARIAAHGYFTEKMEYMKRISKELK